jgi:hypothetical protein
MKILPDNPDKAYQLLKEQHVTVTKKKVILVKIADQPGSLHDMLALLYTHNLNVENCYGVLVEQHKEALIVLEVEDYPDCEKVLQAHRYSLLSDEQVHSH